MSGPSTIVAICSPPGGARRGVVRLSGPRAHALGEAVFPALPARAFTRVEGALRLASWPPVPAAALRFDAPRSYTGEDTVELWVPGAAPLLEALVAALEAAGAEPARPGEFTRRAFLNGRLDLTQAEAVLALTSAEDADLAAAATRSLAGGVGSAIQAARDGLTDVLAHLEAAVDFDDEDVPLTPSPALCARLRETQATLSDLAGRLQHATPRAQAHVALVGAPNAGKSTLFNALTSGDALVSPQQGTTRDVLQAEWTLPQGRRVLLADTAGLDASEEVLERAAQALTEEAVGGADARLLVVDPAQPDPGWRAARARLAPPTLLVWSKHDLAVPPPAEGLAVSATTGHGLAELGSALEAALADRAAAGADVYASGRQRGHLHAAQRAVGDALRLLEGDDPARTELGAFEVQTALEALGALVGEVTTDDVLERIFGQFCIGK